MKKRLEIARILREFCKWKYVNIIIAEVCPNYVYMFVEISSKLSILSFMRFSKDESSVMIYQKWGNMKYEYRNSLFWCGDIMLI